MAIDKLKSGALNLQDDVAMDTDTLYVDSTNNRVGVGTSSPKRHLHINDPSAVSTKIQITNSATGSGSDGEGFQLGIGSSGQASIEQRENQPLTFSTNNTERLRILSSGGITFNGDTAAANALDDYEEGDFAYTLPFSTSGSMTVRAGYERGYYTKVGRMVTIHLRFESNGNSGSLSGDLRIAGFPFTFTNVTPNANSNVSYVYPLHLRGVSSTSFDYDLSFYFLADPGTNYGRLIGQGEGNTHAQTVITSGDIPTNIEGTLAFTYLVNA